MALRVDRVNLQIILEEQRKGDALEKMNADIREQKRLVDQLAQRRERVMESYGNDPEAEAVKSITAQYEQARKRLQELDQKKGEYISSTKMETMNMYQLRQELKYYQGILKGLSPDTEVFRRTQGYVAQLKGRLKELNGEVSKTGGSFKLFGSSGKSSLLGLAENFNHISFAVKHVIALASKLKDAFVAVYNYFEPMAKAAMELEGIERAFKRINQPGMLDNLREATHGTVSDLELMKQAVKFKDFNLPVEQLGTYLAFAQQKAKDTGESIDYLVNSIVTGLGRQSPLILDNLGLSAKQISDEAKRSGDFFGAVATIIEQRMSEAGDYVETFAERAKQGEVELENAQADLGKSWLPVKEAIDSTWTTLQMWMIKSIAKIFEFVEWCKELYDDLGTIRLVVEALVVTFDTAFKLIETGFWVIVDVVKALGYTIQGLSNMIEGALTFDWAQVKRGWEQMGTDLADTFTHLADKAIDAGQRWGDNFIGSINRTIDGRVKAPEVPNNTAPEVTILGKKRTGDDDKPRKTTLKKDPYAADLAELEKANRQKQNLIKLALAKQYLTESEAQEQQYANQQAFYAAKIALQKKYGKDSTDTEGQVLDALIAETRRKENERKKAERDIQQQHRDELKELDAEYVIEQTQLTRQRLSGELATEKEYQEKKLEAELDYLTRKLALIKAQGGDVAAVEKQIEELRLRQMTGLQAEEKASLDRQMTQAALANDFDTQLSLLQQQLDAKLITQEQYEDELTRITEEKEAQRHQIREAFTEQAQQLLQSASSLFSALQSREEKRVDDKYKKLIASAKKQGKDTSKLEEQQEAETLAIQKKYADKQFAMTVLQIVAQTALGIQKIWAEWGWNPPVAVGLTATTAAISAIQLATAKAQREQAAGLYTGGYSDEYAEGYTGNGNPRDVAGVIPVHRKEFVINHEALAVPAVRRVANVIDSMQKRKAYAMQNATAELQRVIVPPLTLPRGGGGLYEGGYSSGVQEFRSSDGGESVGRLEQLLERNNALLDEMIESGVTVLELRREIRKQEQLERNASR